MQPGTVMGSVADSVEFKASPSRRAQYRPLGFWRMAVPSVAAPRYCALVEAESLTMEHQVTMCPEVPIMS